MRIRRVHHAGFTVSDIDRSIAFYRDVLGMKLVRRQEGTAEYLSRVVGFPGVQLDMAFLTFGEDQEYTLELLKYKSHPGEPVPTETNRPGNRHLCFIVDDIWAAYRELTSQGVVFVNEPAEVTAGINKGARAAYFRDPDGFSLEMIQPPPAG